MNPDVILKADSTTMPVDPSTLDGLKMVQDGTAFNTDVQDAAAQAAPAIDAAVAKLDTVPDTINGVSQSLVDGVSGVGAQLTAAANQLPDFVEHVNDMMGDIMGKATMFASAQGLDNAINGTSGCTDMTDFFGSITTIGPGMLDQLSSLTAAVSGGISSFVQLGQDLQPQIISAQSALLSGLSQSGVSGAVQALQTQITNEFGTAVGDVRAQLSDQAMALMTDSVKANVLPAITQMKGTDFDISAAANTVMSGSSQISSVAQGLVDLGTGEKNIMKEAVAQLEQLGGVSSVQSLFNSNPCVQSLMGFVATNGFLKTLGG
jgi:hypothetical protein